MFAFIKNLHLKHHPETRIIRDTHKRVQVCCYQNGIAYCTNGEWYEIKDFEG